MSDEENRTRLGDADPGCILTGAGGRGETPQGGRSRAVFHVGSFTNGPLESQTLGPGRN